MKEKRAAQNKPLKTKKDVKRVAVSDFHMQIVSFHEAKLPLHPEMALSGSCRCVKCVRGKWPGAGSSCYRRTIRKQRPRLGQKTLQLERVQQHSGNPQITSSAWALESLMGVGVEVMLSVWQGSCKSFVCTLQWFKFDHLSCELTWNFDWM